jgi:hypothetical protein
MHASGAGTQRRRSREGITTAGDTLHILRHSWTMPVQFPRHKRLSVYGALRSDRAGWRQDRRILDLDL